MINSLSAWYASLQEWMMQEMVLPILYAFGGSLLQSKAKIEKATLEIRRGKAHTLLARAENIVDHDEWIRITLSYSEVDELVRDVLWHLDDVKVLEPQIVRERVIQALDELIVRHG